MQPLYIFDLDGTLALIEHRRHFVTRPACQHCGWFKDCDHSRDGTRPVFKADWRGFFGAVGVDAPNVPVILTLKALRQAAAEIWIWSGRSDECKAATVEWLLKHGCMCDLEQLRMRKAGDHRDDVTVKAEWLAEIAQADRERLAAVFDDRDRVVQMWRDAGIACFQVAPGEF